MKLRRRDEPLSGPRLSFFNGVSQISPGIWGVQPLEGLPPSSVLNVIFEQGGL